MNTFNIGCIVVVLLVHASSADHTPNESIKNVNSAYYFSFSNLHKVMNLEIKLKNIPTSVTSIFITSIGKYSSSEIGDTLGNVTVSMEDIKDGQVTIPFQSRLENYNNVLTDVVLQNTEGLCARAPVAKGRRSLSGRDWGISITQHVYRNTNWISDTTGSCLAPNICKIVIDFHNQCDVQVSCEYNTTEYTCMFHCSQLTDPHTAFRLYHTYNSEPVIFGYNLVFFNVYKNTKLIIELESFDNNTSMMVAESEYGLNKVWSSEVIVTANHVVEDKIVGTLIYSGSTDVHFSCDNLIHPPKINIALTVLVDTKKNRVKTMHHAKNIDKIRIKMEDNGSILCCMYYTSERTDDWEYEQITRVVVNKTLLRYQPEEPVSPEADMPAGSSTTQTIERDADSSSTTQTIERDADNVSNKDNTTMIVISTLCGIAFTGLVVLVLWKCDRLHCTRSPQGTRELPTPTVHEPFYLNLLFRRQCEQEIAAIEAHIYEEIVPRHRAPSGESSEQVA
ncbi:hypothetical protein PYW08_010882 [Mythimna loreyi]|uniref:Uncharacterized protein n=1 Tax=Mythimna loreyi TaxID=667449 RepID=A0ACC2Q1N7_9NEOP|nr:hypothetical protein PYW08_010882 [Mythimna loreyi]